MRKEELLKKSGLAYGTIRKYVDYGLIKRPQLEYHGPGEVIAHYPDDSLLRIELIQELKNQGKTLKEIKGLLTKELVAKMSTDILEEKYRVAERGLKTSGDLWLQKAVELMLYEAGAEDEEIGNLPAYLSNIQLERDSEGNIKAIRIEEDPEAKNSLEVQIDRIFKSN